MELDGVTNRYLLGYPKGDTICTISGYMGEAFESVEEAREWDKEEEASHYITGVKIYELIEVETLS